VIGEYRNSRFASPIPAPKKFTEAPAIHAEVEKKLSGADRAAKRFLERRAAGIPMGAPAEGQHKR
jgi:hypothetical protein